MDHSMMERFVPTTMVEFDSYLQWRNQQECERCGLKFADRPRKPDGSYADFWVTEQLCWRCAFPNAEPQQ